MSSDSSDRRAASDDTYDRLRRRISRHDMRAGERLGAERDLALDLGVPRARLRTALDRLREEGLIRQVIGRTGGVYVSDGKIDRVVSTRASVPTLLKRQGYTPTTRVLSARIALTRPPVLRALGLPASSPVIELRRLRLADDVPLSLELTHLPPEQFPGLLQKSLENRSLYDLLAREYGCAIGDVYEDVEARAAVAEESSLLGQDHEAIVMVVTRTSFSLRGVPVEHAVDVFRADRIRLRLKSQP